MSNLNDRAYVRFLALMQKRFREAVKGRPVFTTDADKNKMWDVYLRSFSNRQYHNCCACRSFINRYAGLVVIEPNGKLRSPIWDPDDAITADLPDSDEQERASRRLRDIAEGSRITGVWYSGDAALGHGTAGGWRHMSLENPRPYAGNVGAAKGERIQEYNSLQKAIGQFSAVHVRDAVRLLSNDTLYRGKEFVDETQWFLQVVESTLNNNQLWLAVATAPTGFAKIRSSIVGSLLEDIESGNYTTANIKQRWDAKAESYQRSQAAPTQAQIELAEASVQELGIAPAFSRRYTQAVDLPRQGLLWTPTAGRTPMPVRSRSSKEGLFAGVRAKGPAEAPQKITLEKFCERVLPTAASIEYRVPEVGRFGALTTAVDPTDPPILAWDNEERRNPVAWAFPSPPATAEQWNLSPGEYAPVQALVQTPNMWYDNKSSYGRGVFFLLNGACDTRNVQGGGLFVEHLRSDLRPHRKVIEAHINQQVVSGTNDPDTLAFGIGLLEGNKWTETAAPEPVKFDGTSSVKAVHVILVVDNSGSMSNYLPAARKALRSLLDATKEMPGKVDYTFIRFGDSVDLDAVREPFEVIENIERQIDGKSGNTALNDAIGTAIKVAGGWQDPDAAYFLGIVTDGQENRSRKYSVMDVRNDILRVLKTGAWTVAYAGAGNNPRTYAREIGVPENNIKAFSASARGFEEAGSAYAAGTRALGKAYKTGARSTNTFFSAAAGAQEIGTDYPVFVVTSQGGQRTAYTIDRWE